MTIQAAVALQESSSLREAARAMQDSHTSAVMVYDGERFAGILTRRDIVRAVASGAPTESAAVGQWMTANPETLAHAETDSAGQIMAHGGFGHLPLLDGEVIVGVLSIRDLARSTFAGRVPRGV